jgi:hypothetical protein
MAPRTVTLPGEVFPDQAPRLGSETQGVVGGPSYARAFRDIEQLATLTPGWDSYGAPAIGEQARLRAARLLSMIATHLDERVPSPTVGPSASGGAVLRWLSEEHEVVAEILDEGGSCAVVTRETDKVVQEGPIDHFDSLLQDVIRRYLTSA